jgi:hypothetical protein
MNALKVSKGLVLIASGSSVDVSDPEGHWCGVLLQMISLLM